MYTSPSALSAITLILLAGSASATSASQKNGLVSTKANHHRHLPTASTRSIGIKAIRASIKAILTARKLAVKERQERKLQQRSWNDTESLFGGGSWNNTELFDRTNMTDLFGGGSWNDTDLFGGLNMTDFFGFGEGSWNDTDLLDGLNMTDLFGFGEGSTDLLDGLNETNLFGGSWDDAECFGCGDLFSSFASMICGLFDSPLFNLVDMMQHEMGGLVCTEFGCDDPNAETPNLIMNCGLEEEYCDDYHSMGISDSGGSTPMGGSSGGGDDGEKFCVKNTETEMSIELDFTDVQTTSSKQCTEYTSPEYLASKGRACFTLETSTNMSAVMGGMDSFFDFDDFDWNATDYDVDEEDAVALASEYFTMDACEGRFEDGTECVCGVCDDFKGFELKCTGKDADILGTEECMSFEDAGAGGISVELEMDMMEGNGEDMDLGNMIDAPGMSVLRLVVLPTDGDNEVSVESDASDGGATAEKGDDSDPGEQITAGGATDGDTADEDLVTGVDTEASAGTDPGAEDNADSGLDEDADVSTQEEDGASADDSEAGDEEEDSAATMSVMAGVGFLASYVLLLAVV